jgi:hypothetical protein
MCIATHGTLQDNIIAITLESGAHVQREFSHLLPHHTQRWMDIVITRDCCWTLGNVATTDSIHIDSVQHALMMIIHVTTLSFKTKHNPT